MSNIVVFMLLIYHWTTAFYGQWTKRLDKDINNQVLAYVGVNHRSPQKIEANKLDL